MGVFITVIMSYFFLITQIKEFVRNTHLNCPNKVKSINICLDGEMETIMRVVI